VALKINLNSLRVDRLGLGRDREEESGLRWDNRTAMSKGTVIEGQGNPGVCVFGGAFLGPGRFSRQKERHRSDDHRVQ
jgi:hypothetical protein